jgi:predicted metal-binding membrane protein
MMSVMMAPSVAPWIAAYHRFSGFSLPGRSHLRATAVFAAGYLAIWTLFGLGVALVQRGVGTPFAFGWQVLVGAGLYQLSPLKRACLTHCRSPLTFLLARWRDGPASAFHLGLQHGAYCVGCCWALMLTGLAVGFTSFWWMGALTAVTFAEQASPWGVWLRPPLGVALIGGGLLI